MSLQMAGSFSVSPSCASGGTGVKCGDVCENNTPGISMFSALNEPLLASSPSSTGTGADALEAPPEYTGHWGALCGFFGVKMPYLNEHLTQDYKKVLDTCKSFAKREKNTAAREMFEKTGYVLQGETYYFTRAERAPGRKPEEVFTLFPLDHLVTRPTLQSGEAFLARLAEERGGEELCEAAEALRRINRAAGIPEPGQIDTCTPRRYVVEEPGGDFNEHVKRFKRKVFDMSQKTRWPNRLRSETYFDEHFPTPPRLRRDWVIMRPAEKKAIVRTSIAFTFLAVVSVANWRISVIFVMICFCGWAAGAALRRHCCNVPIQIA